MWFTVGVTIPCLKRKNNTLRSPMQGKHNSGLYCFEACLECIFISCPHTHPLCLSVARRSCHPPLLLPVSWQLSVLSSPLPSPSAPLEFQSHVLLFPYSTSTTCSSTPSAPLVFQCLLESCAHKKSVERGGMPGFILKTEVLDKLVNWTPSIIITCMHTCSETV